MSLQHFVSQAIPNPQLNPRFASLVVDGVIQCGSLVTIKNTVNKSWNPGTTDSVDMVASGNVLLSLNTSALTAGLISSKLTINNTSVVPTTQVLTNISDYSGLPASYDGMTPVPCPNIFVSGIRANAFDLQIVSNGYGSMGVNDTLTVFIAIR
jgi:hypothetical protein